MSQAHDIIHEKRQSLRKHLPFITTMRKKMQEIKNSDLEAKWSKMSTIISSDTQPLSIEQMNKLESTIINLQKQFTTKSPVNHQPLATVKTEISDQHKSNNVSTKPSLNVPNETSPNKSTSFSEPLNIKKVPVDSESLPAKTESNMRTRGTENAALNVKMEQSLVETDQNESLDDSEEIPLKLQKKTLLRKRADPRANQEKSNGEQKFGESSNIFLPNKRKLSSEDSSDSDTPKNVQRKWSKTLKKRRVNLLKSSSPETSRTRITEPGEEDKKVLDLKRLLTELASGEAQNSKEILGRFESIIGKEGFTNLKSLFTENPSEKVLESSSSCSSKSEESKRGSDEQDTQHEKQLVKKKKTMNEAEKLKADVMNMFIRDGVLSANGLRNNKKVAYDEDSALQVMQELEIDPISDEFNETESSDCERDDESPGSEKEGTSRSASENDIVSTLHHSASSSVNTSEEETTETIAIDECYVKIEKIDLSMYKMPVRLLANGSFESPAQDQTLTESHELSPLFEAAARLDQSCNTLCVTGIQGGKEKGEVSTPKIAIKSEKSSDTQVRSVESLMIRGMQSFVYNLSYVNCRGGYLLKCNCEKCEYETFDDNLFQYHIQSKHVMFKWSGSCKMCESSVSNFGTLLDEYKHMDQVHIKGISVPKLDERVDHKKKRRGRKKQKVEKSTKPTPPKKSGKAVSRRGRKAKLPLSRNGTTLNNENDQHIDSKSENGKSPPLPESANNDVAATVVAPEAAFNNAGNTLQNSDLKAGSHDSEEVTNKLIVPLLKVRILPGDKLSTKNNDGMPVTSPIEPSSSVLLTHNNFPVAAAPKIAGPTIVKNIIYPSKNITSGATPEDIYTKKLKPWLKAFDFKRLHLTNAMLNEKKLSQKFKCMGSNCDFTSNSPEIFLVHLKFHDESHKSDVLNFSRCSYCLFSSRSSADLVKHILSEHKFEKYSCKHCFYRSAVKYFVHKHQLVFHNDKSGKLIETEITDTPRFSVELAAVEVSRRKLVPAIQCIVCKKKFFVYKRFDDHFEKEHLGAPIPNHRCNICKMVTDKTNLRKHLENCYIVRQFHCLYCRFGVNLFNDLHDHMMNKHPNKIPFFCERNHKTDVDESSHLSIPLKVIGDRSIYD